MLGFWLRDWDEDEVEGHRFRVRVVAGVRVRGWGSG